MSENYKMSENKKVAGVKGPGRAFIEQCTTLNSLLAEALGVAARVIGPQLKAEDLAGEPTCYADSLDAQLETATGTATTLLARLENIAGRF